MYSASAAALSISPAIAIISAMISPALLILGSGSLIASALTRLSRIVDRVRVLIASFDGPAPLAAPEVLSEWIDRHEKRARYVERAIALLFSAVTIFVAACLSLALDHFSGNRLTWLPITLTIIGMLMLMVGGACLTAESRLGAAQMRSEIAEGRRKAAAARKDAAAR